MKQFLQEFKEFAMRGNVLDMAVGVIIGSAFGKITTSLVNDVFMPVLGMLISGVDLAKLNIVLKPAVMDGSTVVSEAVVIGIGSFLTTVLDFILVAFVIFLTLRFVNQLRRKVKPEEPVADATPVPPTTEQLLAEIRDLLKNK